MAQILPHLSGNHLSHAYLIASVSAEERNAIADRLAMAMVCEGDDKPCGVCRHCRKARNGIHPDILIVDRDTEKENKGKREIYVDRIRDIVSDVAICPNEAEKKVYILRNADRMNVSAQNALLKVLEEPPTHACFILCAEQADGLLDTIRSRCVEIHRNAASEAVPEAAVKLVEDYLNIVASGSRSMLLRFCFEQETLTSEQVEQFVRAAGQRITDMLCGRCDMQGLTHPVLLHLEELMETVWEYLQFHVGVKHIFGLLAVKTLKI